MSGPKSAFRMDDEEMLNKFEDLGWIEVVGKSETAYLTKNPIKHQKYFTLTELGQEHRDEIWKYVAKQ
jgi:DNA-binding PadR family transcriptional regulator